MLLLLKCIINNLPFEKGCVVIVIIVLNMSILFVILYVYNKVG